MKYDCNKTLDYVHERKRLCDSKGNSCENCELCGRLCTVSLRIDQEMIDVVQAWSDEHAEQTRQELFLEKHPHTKLYNGIIDINPCKIETYFGDDRTGCCFENRGYTCMECRQEYWGKVVE